MATNAQGGSYNVGQAVRRYLLPTTTDEYQNLKFKYDNDFKSTLDDLDADVATLQVLYEGVRTKRHRTLQRIKAKLPNDVTPDSKSDLEKSSTKGVKPSAEDIAALCDDTLLDEYLSQVSTATKLRKHLTDMTEDAKHFRYLVETQALAEYAHYRGLREWAQRIFPAVDYLATALLALSTVGAGLTYSTIFGATRGDIGLMSFTFPLFTIGFLIPAVVQLVLRWASGLSREVPFASQAFWKTVIIVFMFFASLSVMAAITILNATIFLITPPLPATADGSDSSLDGVGDSIGRTPGIVAFAVSGLIFLLFFVGIALCMVVRGPKEIMRILLQSHREPEKLENYPHV